MRAALADRLMKLCESNAEAIAGQWHKAISNNHRTKAYSAMPKEGCIRHASFIYKNLHRMYFADDCEKAVSELMDVDGFFQDNFARNIPLEQLIYALIMMRRNVWLHAESEGLYGDASDMLMALESINRVLLIFDYAIYQAGLKYKELEGRLINK